MPCRERRLPAIRARDRHNADAACASTLQRTRGGVQGGAGSQHVVNKKDVPVTNRVLVRDAECPGDIFPALRVGQAGLSARGARSRETAMQRCVQMPGCVPREQFRLIETARQPASPVQWDGNHEVEPLRPRDSAHQQPPERQFQRPHAAVLVQVNKPPKRSFVLSVREGRVETCEAVTAEATAPIRIERGRA